MGGARKTPYVVELTGGELFGVARLRFGECDERALVIITTELNELTRPIHNSNWGESGRLTALPGPYPGAR